MPNSKGNRRGQEQEKSRRGRLTEKASSFHGKIPMPSSSTVATAELRRPMTLPQLLSERTISIGVSSPEGRPKLTKLLLNVTIQGSLGAIQVVLSPENDVGDIINAALRQYAKEGRRPIFSSTNPSHFDLHYSQFSLESLDREEKLISLGSRNFFLCPKRTGTATDGGGSSTSCSKEAEKVSKSGIPWLKFIDFML
ncbi:hypothetical protein SLEP1_g43198 [Rubroshorea leprosula]|uniref:DUF7054 domain-containing protein n=1 Tax=Rubroshorea leprosula TaxID=152421 RepID=A0AAV5LDR0_9ROSI|nr:hypothetical protein SLEP1_g43198 [Rubroshorea leprosula]